MNDGVIADNRSGLNNRRWTDGNIFTEADLARNTRSGINAGRCETVQIIGFFEKSDQCLIRRLTDYRGYIAVIKFR